MDNIAIVILSCRDYEALELSLACHAAYKTRGVPIYILQNCRGTYDAERTLLAARRYENLFPGTFKVVDNISPSRPYNTIATLLESEEFSRYDYICKIDDDIFPLQKGWLDRLVECYRTSLLQDRPLAYVSPLINNNLYGFSLTLDALGFREKYFEEADIQFRQEGIRPELVGDVIHRYPHVARWLHEQTTLQPDRFIAATVGLEPIEIVGPWRHSIGCILFRKSLWRDFDCGLADDEQMLHDYCYRTKARIVCARSVPFVHIAYYTQRDELRDITETIRTMYEPRLGHPFPIATHASRMIEIEARLRWMEERRVGSASPSTFASIHRQSFLQRISTLLMKLKSRFNL